MGNRSREMETQTESEMLEIKKTVTGMTNAFDVLISGLDMAKEKISKTENMFMEIPKTETQKGTKYPRTVEQYKGVTNT